MNKKHTRIEQRNTQELTEQRNIQESTERRNPQCQ